MKIDLNKIKNLIVRRSLERRYNDFIFNYGDSDEHSDINHVDKSFRKYNDAWKKYVDHEDYVKPEKHSDYDIYYDKPEYWERTK